MKDADLLEKIKELRAARLRSRPRVVRGAEAHAAKAAKVSAETARGGALDEYMKEI